VDQILEILFESVGKVRVLRLFMHNPDQFFSLKEIRERTQIRSRSLTRDLAKLVAVGLLKRKMGYTRADGSSSLSDVSDKESEARPISTPAHKRRKALFFYVNTEFFLLSELRDLIIRSAVAPRQRLLRQIKGLGKIKLAIISGIFTGDETARTDLLVVGDDIKRRGLERFLTAVEAELGKPIRYTIMDTDEFRYRVDMYDRFLRDILEHPHEKLINKLLNA
jgi:DNA-binding MarR family transcriptional regulator